MFCTAFNILSEAGIPPYLDGFRYFGEALDIISKDPECINHITKEIYPEIGRRHGISGSCVERSMRNALDAARKRASRGADLQLRETLRLSSRRRPTNSEFLSALSEYLDLDP